jgi:hypothetical protein
MALPAGTSQVLELKEMERRLRALEARERREQPALATGLHDLGWVPRCILTRTGNQTIGDDATTNVSWNAVAYDPENLHSDAGNLDRIIIRTGGLYMALANISFGANAVGYRAVWVNAYEGGGNHYFGNIWPQIGAATTTRVQAMGIWPMNVGDYWTVPVRHTAGGDLSVAGHAWSGSPTMVAVYQVGAGLPADL